MGRAFLDVDALWMGTKWHGQDKSVGMLGCSLGTRCVFTLSLGKPTAAAGKRPLLSGDAPNGFGVFIKHHAGFELNLYTGGLGWKPHPLQWDWSEPETEEELRLGGSRAAAPSILLASWDSHPPREKKGCTKATKSTLLCSPLHGIKVTKTLSTCEVQPLKSVNLPQSTHLTHFGVARVTIISCYPSTIISRVLFSLVLVFGELTLCWPASFILAFLYPGVPLSCCYYFTPPWGGIQQ